MENHIGKIKAGVIAVFTAASARLGLLAVPLVLLVACNVMDYVTGLIAAPFRGTLRSSASGFAGIAKKIAMWLLVAVGAIVDILLDYVAANLAISIPVSFAVASLVCVWLLANEVISIIENLSDIGVHIPPFLLPVVRFVKKSAEAKAALPPEDDGTGHSNG